MWFFRNARYDFMKLRRRAMLASAVVIAAGLVSIAVHRGFNLGIDFAGGTLVDVAINPPIELPELRHLVETTGFTGAEVTRFGEADEYVIQVKRIGEAAHAGARIEEALREGLSGRQVEIRRLETVGPRIGSELRTAAFWAVLYSCLGILVYVGWRFQPSFAIAGIIALVHDVLITLGFLSITNREISIPIIAAVLTIVGYSINDTIVIFDRIRENLHTRRREGLATVANVSINETLSRSIITNLTVLFSVIALVVFAGPVIRDFALTMLVGLIAGTYSTIFIASPLLVEWDDYRNRRKHKKMSAERKPAEKKSSKSGQTPKVTDAAR